MLALLQSANTVVKRIFTAHQPAGATTVSLAAGFLEPPSTLPNFPRTPTATMPLTPSPTSKRLQSAWQPPRMLLLQPTTSRHLSLPTSAVPRLPSRSLGPLLLLQAPTHLACQAPALLSVFCPLSCSVLLLRVTLFLAVEAKSCGVPDVEFQAFEGFFCCLVGCCSLHAWWRVASARFFLLVTETVLLFSAQNPLWISRLQFF